MMLRLAVVLMLVAVAVTAIHFNLNDRILSAADTELETDSGQWVEADLYSELEFGLAPGEYCTKSKGAMVRTSTSATAAPVPACKNGLNNQQKVKVTATKKVGAVEWIQVSVLTPPSCNGFMLASSVGPCPAPAKPPAPKPPTPKPPQPKPPAVKPPTPVKPPAPKPSQPKPQPPKPQQPAKPKEPAKPAAPKPQAPVVKPPTPAPAKPPAPKPQTPQSPQTPAKPPTVKPPAPTPAKPPTAPTKPSQNPSQTPAKPSTPAPTPNKPPATPTPSTKPNSNPTTPSEYCAKSAGVKVYTTAATTSPVKACPKGLNAKQKVRVTAPNKTVGSVVWVSVDTASGVTPRCTGFVQLSNLVSCSSAASNTTPATSPSKPPSSPPSNPSPSQSPAAQQPPTPASFKVGSEYCARNSGLKLYATASATAAVDKDCPKAGLPAKQRVKVTSAEKKVGTASWVQVQVSGGQCNGYTQTSNLVLCASSSATPTSTPNAGPGASQTPPKSPSSYCSKSAGVKVYTTAATTPAKACPKGLNSKQEVKVTGAEKKVGSVVWIPVDTLSGVLPRCTGFVQLSNLVTCASSASSSSSASQNNPAQSPGALTGPLKVGTEYCATARGVKVYASTSAAASGVVKGCDKGLTLKQKVRVTKAEQKVGTAAWVGVETLTGVVPRCIGFMQSSNLGSCTAATGPSSSALSASQGPSKPPTFKVGGEYCAKPVSGGVKVYTSASITATIVKSCPKGLSAKQKVRMTGAEKSGGFGAGATVWIPIDTVAGAVRCTGFVLASNLDSCAASSSSSNGNQNPAQSPSQPPSLTVGSEVCTSTGSVMVYTSITASNTAGPAETKSCPKAGLSANQKLRVVSKPKETTNNSSSDKKSSAAATAAATSSTAAKTIWVQVETVPTTTGSTSSSISTFSAAATQTARCRGYVQSTKLKSCSSSASASSGGSSGPGGSNNAGSAAKTQGSEHCANAAGAKLRVSASTTAAASSACPGGLSLQQRVRVTSARETKIGSVSWVQVETVTTSTATNSNSGSSNSASAAAAAAAAAATHANKPNQQQNANASQAKPKPTNTKPKAPPSGTTKPNTKPTQQQQTSALSNLVSSSPKRCSGYIESSRLVPCLSLSMVNSFSGNSHINQARLDTPAQYLCSTGTINLRGTPTDVNNQGVHFNDNVLASFDANKVFLVTGDTVASRWVPVQTIDPPTQSGFIANDAVRTCDAPPTTTSTSSDSSSSPSVNTFGDPTAGTTGAGNGIATTNECPTPAAYGGMSQVPMCALVVGNFRLLPDATSSVQGSFMAIGDPVIVGAQTGDGWRCVTDNQGRSGWTQSSYVGSCTEAMTGPCANKGGMGTEITDPTYLLWPRPSELGFCIMNGATFRACPNTDDTVNGALRAGSNSFTGLPAATEINVPDRQRAYYNSGFYWMYIETRNMQVYPTVARGYTVIGNIGGCIVIPPAQDAAHGLNYMTTRYKQDTPPWGSQDLGMGCDTDDGGRMHMDRFGCAIVAMSMWAVKQGCSDADCNPGALNTWLRDVGGGFVGCLVKWQEYREKHLMYHAFVPRKIEGQTPHQYHSYARMQELYNQGYGLIIRVRSDTHYTVVTGFVPDSQNFYVADPLPAGNGERVADSYSDVSEFHVYAPYTP